MDSQPVLHVSDRRGASHGDPGTRNGLMAISESRPTHAVLPGTNWGLWRQVVVRAAGFPAPGVELINSPALARAADILNEREQDGGDGDGRRLRYEAEFQAETERLAAQIL